MKFKFLVSALLFLLLLAQACAKDFSVGVSPSLIDLGEIQQDSSKPLSFFILSPSDEPVIVYLEAAQPLIDFFSRPNYKDYVFNYSEEQTSSWVQTFSNPVELKPTGELQTYGGNIKGWREVNLLLNVPKDAEPGYHLVEIIPKPSLPRSSLGQVGVQIATITPIIILFKTPGDAIRQGKILDVTTGSYTGNGLQLLIHFLNTGTVTVSARAEEIKIFDSEGKLVKTLTSSQEKVKPNEKKALTAFLSLDGIKEGEYKVYTKVNFVSGTVEKNSTIKILPALALAPQPSKPFEFPVWILILFGIIIIIIIAYRFWHEE
ncbi:MAG: hypothetical protein ACP5O8_01365 [Candidatus Aenigmatarchaeota archaeon]